MYDQKKTSEKYIQEILNMPENMKVESIISLGYPAEDKLAIAKELLDYNKIKFNSYKNK